MTPPGKERPAGCLLAWVHVRTPRCLADRALPAGASVACLSPGKPGHPVAVCEGPIPNGWTGVAPWRQGTIVEQPGVSCDDCPFARLPAGVHPLRVEVHATGLRAQVMAPSVEALDEAIRSLRSDGSMVRLEDAGRVAAAPAQSFLALDLSGLTAPQWRALWTASRLGYFDHPRRASVRDVAQELGCSSATAHGHLRKAVAKVLHGVAGVGAAHA